MARNDFPTERCVEKNEPGINNNEVVASKSRRIVKNLRWWVLVLFLLGVTVNYITRNSLGILAPN
jgi:ACS family hexuronate transporter-like MFS transporter